VGDGAGQWKRRWAVEVAVAAADAKIQEHAVWTPDDNSETIRRRYDRAL
jgi:hypothetical protein